MKNLITYALVTACSASAFGQDRAIGTALERYGVLAGGWALNLKCKFVSGDALGVFERDFAVVNASLGTTLGPGLVLRIQGSAAKAAEAEPYASCPKTAEDIVRYSASASAQWAGEIRRVVLDASTRLPGGPR